jgi:hypothetical protein
MLFHELHTKLQAYLQEHGKSPEKVREFAEILRSEAQPTLKAGPKAPKAE